MKFLVFLLWVYTAFAQQFRPLAPSEDKFYQAPANLSAYRNGDIINFRNAPTLIRSVYFPANVKNAWQLLVRSEDSHGEPNAIVTTILEPYDADPTKLVSFQSAQDAATQDCSPSYSLLFNAPMSTLVIQFESVLMQTALAKGWYLVLPDYEGAKGAFTVGRQSGYATLNSLRAAIKSTRFTGIDPEAKAGLWGYSGGSLASGWAAALQPSHAPELKKNLVGAALGGWVTNITLTAEAVDGKLFSGLIPNAINGIMNEYPEVEEIMKDQLVEDRKADFAAARSKCLAPSILSYASATIFQGNSSWIKSGYDFFRIPLVQEIVNNNTLALSENGPIPEIPLFVYHGLADEVVPFSGALRGFENYCKWGSGSVELAVSNTTGHIVEWVGGAGAALVWLEKMLKGGEPVQGCKSTYRSSNVLYPGADVQFHQMIKTFLSSVAGGKVGETTRKIIKSTILSYLLQQLVGHMIEVIGSPAFLNSVREILALPEHEGTWKVLKLLRRLLKWKSL